MTVASSTIKTTAKDILKKNGMKSVIVCSALLFCYLINYNIISCLSLVTGDIVANVLFIVALLFLFAPVLLGALRYFWRMICGVSDNPTALFYYFTSKKLYKKSMQLILNLAVKTALFALVLLIPYFIVSAISSAEFFEAIDVAIPLWTANLANMTVFLKTIAIVATISLMLKFYLAPMLLVADENMEVTEAIHMSAVISRNTMLDFISLIFTMLGWILLSLLFIPLLYTLPLFITVYLTHCSFAVADYNNHIKQMNEKNFPNFVAGI